MSSSGPSNPATTLDLSPRPSLRALRWAFALHGLCIVLLLAAQPPAPALLALAGAIGASWLWVRRHPALGFGPKAWTQLIRHADGRWTVRRASGQTQQAELADDAIVRGPVLILRLRLEDGVCATRVLCGDELPDELMRRLRAGLSTS